LDLGGGTSGDEFPPTGILELLSISGAVLTVLLLRVDEGFDVLERGGGISTGTLRRLSRFCGLEAGVLAFLKR
jgi:hypothetical protein